MFDPLALLDVVERNERSMNHIQGSSNKSEATEQVNYNVKQNLVVLWFLMT